MRVINFIAFFAVVFGILGWYVTPATTIIEQIYLMCTLMASVVTPYVLVKLLAGWVK